ncbi:MAG TPA: hypothetical protein VMV69_00195 [Pirellulales bacterium]|nr:hypothetical protein [Pirellulales bacterium]
MIYLTVDANAPFRQGDILRNVPRVDLSLDEMTVFIQDPETGRPEYYKLAWNAALGDENAFESIRIEETEERRMRAVLAVSPVIGIVISQDCDASRADDLSMCEVVPFSSVYKNAPEKRDKWVKTITQQDSSHYVKGFYLPPDERIGFSERMAVDFQCAFQIPGTNMDALKMLRIGRLNRVASEHFREKLAHFFRRYAYDPWYPLTKEEFQDYNKSQGGNVKPFSWQE